MIPMPVELAELAELVAAPVVVAEGGGWAAFVPGLPVHGEGDLRCEAVDDLIDALREYAQDWNGRLHTTANHAGAWAAVLLVMSSTEKQLKGWVAGAEGWVAGVGS